MPKPLIHIAFLCLLTLSACGVGEKINETEPLVEKFQVLFNNRSFAGMYKSMLHPDWRNGQTTAEFHETMTKIRDLSGERLSGIRTGYNWKSTIGTGTTVVVSYKSEFANGTINETYTFRTFGENLKLLGYNFKSEGKLKTPQAEEA